MNEAFCRNARRGRTDGRTDETEFIGPLPALPGVQKVKNTVPWTYVIVDLKGKEIAGKFYEKELQKTNQKEFRAEKEMKRKGNMKK